tara:strand:+ start:40 stop:228 length:189 start_codon:yes stop_codon:yes gene_type:complete
MREVMFQRSRPYHSIGTALDVASDISRYPISHALVAPDICEFYDKVFVGFEVIGELIRIDFQ